MIRALSLCALTLAALPAFAEDAASPEALAAARNSDQGIAIAACRTGATDPDAADQALVKAGFQKTEDEGSWQYTSATLTVMMWTVPGFCMIEDSETGTKAMAAALLALSDTPLKAGTDGDGCTTYRLDGDVTGTLTGPGQDPECTSETGATLRFSLPN